MILRLLLLALGLLAGLQLATQVFAWTYGFDAILGWGVPLPGETKAYPPWRILVWRRAFGEAQPEAFSSSAFLILLGAMAGLGIGSLTRGKGAHRRIRGWGGLTDARRAGLRADAGCALGVMKGRLLATLDMRPTLVTGGTRSGKGRGHVTPTLLLWSESVLVHDPKKELWRVTAGWRSRFSHAFYFDPRDALSARWNPLAEIRPGAGELAQVQRLVSILSDPGGVRDDEAIWDKAASEILEAVILHVLYTADDDAKTLLTVRELLADLDDTADVMVKALHRSGADGQPETHPFIRTAVKGYAAMHDRFRTSVQGTARSYLKWLAGDDLERALSASDFALGDLMCAEAPVSLYVQVAPADAAALRPLVRLLFYAAAQALTVHETQDAAGRLKRHRLLMLMDEFPLLGRVSFFEKSLRLLSGYGVKVMFVAQSLNDIVETYGTNNTILDNCAVYTAFSALDPLTQDKVSRLTGTIGETRESRSTPAGLASGRSSVSRSEIDRPLLEPGEVRALPDELQLIFVAGRRPLRTRKLQYDRRKPFRDRADATVPDQAAGVDAPTPAPHPWAGRRSLGVDAEASLPLFKEIVAAMDDKKVAARAADIYGRVAQEMAAQDAALDHLKGDADG
ncbi:MULTISPECIES: type IV secretory system conjugative DNA transfer family protein [Brevundimonas]|jgi:type IV secretion system protein VirD4|uniref:Type IV secretion system protein VirD4 n=1 Tax=Brevundimonas aurantiaca TaxID=74316 RepID=A0A7W9C807_9CAUL|nr:MULTISPECIES: type IV secretory system conjugative DNA transfer family protein [Brevundimonas]MBB5740790.1 type IV secretion system protein VirD4 [Brevundimonas aurantiaca]MDM8354287.1 type IV secretory system conjugative DNA transfer family protein [Brevundimonas diminuta]